MSDFARLQELVRAAGIQVTPPSHTAVPYVSPETATVGAVLNCTMGEWTGEPTGYAYSWQRVGNAAEIGTGDNYTTVAGDVDTAVHCVVTATNGAGSAVAPPSNSVTITASARRGEPAAASALTHGHDPHSDARTEARRK